MQLKEVEATGENGRGTASGMGMEKPPMFDRTYSWAAFWCQFETTAEHNCWTHLEISIYLITTLKHHATDMLQGVLKGRTYEETLDALEDCFRDQPLAAAYRSQPGCWRIFARTCHSH
jgi:hypothetical protein